MHAKALTCFNFFNFDRVSTKFPINIEHVILTNRMFFVFRIATFLAVNDVTNLPLKNEMLGMVNFMHLFGRRH